MLTEDSLAAENTTQEIKGARISGVRLIHSQESKSLFLNHLQFLLFQAFEVLFQLCSDLDDILIPRIFCIDDIRNAHERPND